MEKVTVYITTKNRPNDFARALDSVINQTYDNIEIIVVDDGSSLGNSDLNKSICLRDSRVLYLKNNCSVGAPAARNLAISSASGFFVTGLDDDDIFEKNRLELFVRDWNILMATNEKKNIGFLYSQCKVFTSKKDYFFSKFPRSAKSESMLVRNCVGNQIFAPLKNWIEAGLFNESMPAWQDLEFFYRFCFKVGIGVLVDAPTYVFFDIRSADRISTKGVDRIKSAYNLFLCNHPHLSDKEKAWLYMQIFGRYYGFKPCLDDILYFFSLRPSIYQQWKFFVKIFFRGW